MTLHMGMSPRIMPERAVVAVHRDGAVECVCAEVEHLKYGEEGEMLRGWGFPMVDDDNGWSPTNKGSRWGLHI